MATDEPPTFATLLTRYRAALGLTQEELAERAGLSVRGLRDLERGVKTRPRAYTVGQLVDALALVPDNRALFERVARAVAVGGGEETLPIGSYLDAPPSTALVAREEELERIRSILGAVADGAGQFLVLSGELGIGKTRLLHEVVTDARVRGYVVLGGRCSAARQPSALFPLSEALSGLATRPPHGLRTEVQRSWKRLAGMMADLPSNGDGGGGAFQQHELFGAITDLLLLVSRSMPVALVLDDLHWADEQSLLLLAHLSRATRSARVLLLGAFRDTRIAEEHLRLADILQTLSRERLVERLAIRRLSLEETTRLVGVLMGDQPVSEEFAHFVYRRTKGVPRLVEQLVRSLGGRLALQGEIGAGAMGRVFRAFDRTLEQTVAAKLVLARQEIGLDALLRFQQEGAVLARLDHPHIVDIYGTFAEEHASCIIMELLDGRSLGQILHDGPVSLARAKTLILQVAEALSYAHSQDIIHRDIKPDNVMVLPDDQVKVTDFGIARILQPDTSLQTIATTGMRMGTPLYMSPEQIEGKKVDGRTDIYALGAMLYHMVTGTPPFEGSDALALAVKHLQEEPPRPSQVEPTMPVQWDAVIIKALAKAPRDRYQSAGEMRRAIEVLPVGPVSPETQRIRRYRLPAVAAGAGTAFVSVVMVLALLWPHFVAGQSQSPVQRKLEGYLTSLVSQRQFSGTVLVAEKGKTLLAQGYGMANRQNTIPNSTNTEFAAAGETAILDAAALKLEVEGRLHDQDRVCTYLPSCPRSWKPMTVQMVLAGTSGLSSSFWGNSKYSTTQSVSYCQAEPLTETPGSGPVNYQDCADVVLGTIFQKVTGKPFASTMRRLVFGPAGMRQSGRIFDQNVPPRLARGYSGTTAWQYPAFNDYFQIYTTVTDMYRYDNALFGAKLLSQRALRRLIAQGDPVTLADPAIVGARWGYYWKVGTLFGHQVVYTTGNSWSFTGVNMRFPAEGVTIIVMSNDNLNDVESVATHVAASVFGASVASQTAAIAPAVTPSKAIVARINVPYGGPGLSSFDIVPTNNAVWVPGPPAPTTTGSVVRVDPRTNKVVATIQINNPAALPSGDAAVTFVAVGNGQVWVTDRVRNSLDQIDPATNRVVARIPVGIHPFGLAIAGHTLWTDNYFDDPGVVNTIVKVDLRTQKRVATITNAQTTIGQPYFELHATPNALWFADWGSGTLKRLDASTNKVVASIQTGPQPTSLAVAQGAIWVSNHTSTLVTRVDPTRNSVGTTIPFQGYTTGQPTASDCCVSATAAGAGAVWTVAGADTRTLVRIDPRTNEATAALTLPQSIDEIAVGDGSVWVESHGQIDRLDPNAIP